jgi:uncharacterized protein YuzB (UPF0349 family)
MMKEKLLEELEFCIKLWEKQGHCEFGGHTNCKECATPYLLLKLINGEVLHGDMERLTLDDWKKKVEDIKNQP